MADIKKLKTKIDPSKVGIPKQIEFGPSTFELAPSLFDPTIWERSQEVRGEPIGGFYSTGGGYRSTEPVDVNGIPVFGLYDSSGKLWKYEADHRAGAAVDGGTLYGAWDVSGNPVPVTRSSGGGGFLGSGVGPDISFTDVRDTAEAAGVVAGNYFLPGSSLVSSQLVSEGAQEQLGSDVGMLANLAAGGAGAYGGNLANYGTVGEALGVTSGATGTAAGSTGTGLQATGSLGLTGAGTSAYGGLGAGLGEATAASGIGGSAIGGLGLTAGTGAAYGGLGAGLGTSAAAMGTGSLLGTGAGTAAGTAGALTAADLAKANLIQGGLGLVGGLLQGDTTKSSMEADAAARAALAQKTMDMGKFQPVGTTTRFGTSSFATDPVTGAITPSYSLSPEALAYQNSLSALGTQGLQAGQTMMNLGQQYVGESPEAVRQRYMSTQNALLAPGNEQALAGLRTNLMNTGRQGLAYGATDAGGMGATNPELAAYYNSLATQQRQLAAGAETQYQNQVNFGTGLMGSATTPFTNVFGAQKAVEAAGQQPLAMSTDFANTVATRGAAQGANYAAAMNPSLQSSYNAANYNPYATALQGAANNPLVGYGLLKAWS